MTEAERDALVEQVAGAFRASDPRDGRAQPHPAWRDLDDAGRTAALDRAAASRRLEAALDPDGLSSTARAILARIRR